MGGISVSMRAWDVYPADVSFPPRAGKYALQKWTDAGLRKPTTVRIAKRLRLPKSIFVKWIGRLHMIDILAVQSLLAK